MTISAKIIAHSRHYAHEKSYAPRDLITFQLRYPRFIHAEVMTYRTFSRNASSSRAVPVMRSIEDVMRDPAMPIHWGKNQKGMQADEENDALIYNEAVSPFDMLEARFEGVTAQDAWLKARDNAVNVARALAEAGYHKQVVNRILEPFSHISVIVTATGYDNFYWQRRHADAQPEIHRLADLMWAEQCASTPRVLQSGEWHVPYVSDEERATLTIDDLLKISTARCARVSYLTHDGQKPSVEQDFKLYDRLVGSTPLHASPPEHQARPDFMFRDDTRTWASSELSGNFDHGWVQHRKMLPEENCTHYVGDT